MILYFSAADNNKYVAERVAAATGDRLVSFGLSRRLDSPRIHMAVEPYPNRWTHHAIVADVGEIDDELMGWLTEAHDFALVK